MQQITIIIPCYNEENRIPLQEYRKFLFNNPTIELVLVNDGSRDSTLDLLTELKSEFSSQIRILSLNSNVGKAEAVRKGILSNQKFEKQDIIGFMDADLSTPFEEIGYFLAEFRNPRIQFVFGSRFSRIGAHIKRFHHRHYLGRIVATMVSLYLNMPIYDSQCGAKFFHVGFAQKLFKAPFISRWLFDVELFKRITLLGLHVKDCSLELPLHTWIEKGGSKVNFKDYLKLPLEFLKIIMHYITKNEFHHNYPTPAKKLTPLAPTPKTSFP